MKISSIKFSILKSRICDLNLNIKGSFVDPLIKQLYRELASAGLNFKPHIWISTSWFCPYGVPGFAIPFYLLDPKLQELEKEFIGEVEGGSDNWCMQLLRHEAGHAIDNAFLLRKNKRRQQIFGLSGTPYPKSYLAKPYSKNFVRHLKYNYAQSHPDEDWAETFAVLLDPKSDWKNRYKHWKALKKLELAHEILQNIRGRQQKVSSFKTVDDIKTCTQTIERYFEKKIDKYAPKQVPETLNAINIKDISINSKILYRELASHIKQRQYIIKKDNRETLESNADSYYGDIIYNLSAHVQDYVKHKKHWITM